MSQATKSGEMQVKKIISIFELFIKQKIECKFVLFLMVQTLCYKIRPITKQDVLLFATTYIK